MHVVEQRAPHGILLEDDVGEAGEMTVELCEDRAARPIRLRQALAPHGEAVGEDVAVEECVRVGAAVVAAPTVGVQCGDGLGVAVARTSELQALQADTSFVAPATSTAVAQCCHWVSVPQAMLSARRRELTAPSQNRPRGG